jgi:hypothetical protein
LEDVHDDLRKLKGRGRGEKRKNREEWRQIVQEDKAHPELERREVGRMEGGQTTEENNSEPRSESSRTTEGPNKVDPILTLSMWGRKQNQFPKCLLSTNLTMG